MTLTEARATIQAELSNIGSEYASEIDWVLDVIDDRVGSHELGDGEQAKRAARYLAETADYYGKSIQLFEQVKAKLLDELKSTSRNWFSDTPQNKDGGSEDLSHLTTFGKTETVDAMQSPISRYREAVEGLRAIYWDWSTEFINRFSMEASGL